MAILVLEDKLGITDAYMGAWESMCMAAGLPVGQMRRYSCWKSPTVSKLELLIRKGNRATPGFNPAPEVQHALRAWLRDTIHATHATAVLCMDLAMLGRVESSWDIATIDNLRGGLYHVDSCPFLITVPVSAIHSKKSPKDIRAMNDGHEDKTEFEEDDERDDKEIWLEPYQIPYGKWVLAADLRKLSRIIAEGQGK